MFNCSVKNETENRSHRVLPSGEDAMLAERPQIFMIANVHARQPFVNIIVFKTPIAKILVVMLCSKLRELTDIWFSCETVKRRLFVKAELDVSMKKKFWRAIFASTL